MRAHRGNSSFQQIPWMRRRSIGGVCVWWVRPCLYADRRTDDERFPMAICSHVCARPTLSIVCQRALCAGFGIVGGGTERWKWFDGTLVRFITNSHVLHDNFTHTHCADAPCVTPGNLYFVFCRIFVLIVFMLPLRNFGRLEMWYGNWYWPVSRAAVNNERDSKTTAAANEKGWVGENNIFTVDRVFVSLPRPRICFSHCYTHSFSLAFDLG